MKKKINICLLMTVLVFLICGCSSKDSLPDTFVPGKDYQYYTAIESSFALGPCIQYTENGAYFRLGEFLYYYDRLSNEICPLCDKPDCLHDKETDIGKKESCNAYLHLVNDVFEAPGLQYYDGSLYVMYNTAAVNGGSFAEDLKEGYVLYEISGDGAYKDEIWRADDGWSPSFFIVHRGKVYIIESTFSTVDGKVFFKEELIELPLKGTKKRKVIYSYEVEPKGLDKIVYLRAYGNYLYFEVERVNYESVDGEYILSEFKDDLFAYDLKDGSLKTITIPAENTENYSLQITFYGDKLILHPYFVKNNDTEELYYNTDVYEANLDGSQPRVVIQDIPQGCYVESDDKYLYVNNSIFTGLQIDGEGGRVIYSVYDSDYKKIDAFAIPQDLIEYNLWEIPIGCPEWGGIPVNCSEKGMQRFFSWNKADIGCINEKDIDLGGVAYDYVSPYVRQELFQSRNAR